MIRHLITLIWNKKKAHTLLIVEMTASFLVLFGLSSLIIYNLGNYRQPLGFTYDRVWAINLGNNEDTVDVAAKTEAIRQRLQTYPGIEVVSRMSDNSPFSAYYNSSSVARGRTQIQAQYYTADEQFAQVLSIPLRAGRWYRNVDSVGRYQPVIINRAAQAQLFGTDDAVGKFLSPDTDSKPGWRVVGVIDRFKGRGEFSVDEPLMIELLNHRNQDHRTLLVRVKPGADASLEAQLVRDLTAMVNGWSVDVSYLSESRRSRLQFTLIPMLIASVVSGFLLINVALGLFGVLNVSITRRRGEIGLRRALGATTAHVSWQIVGEMWVLATFALVIGLLVAGQFPLLNAFGLRAGVYLLAMATSSLIVYALVTVCALYPSRQAATIQPAVALHDD